MFEDCNEAGTLDAVDPATSGSGVAAYPLDPEAASRLWISTDFVAAHR